MFNFSPDSYVGVWNVGWPLPWYSFNAKLIAENDEGPYFALHHLNSADFDFTGMLANIALITIAAAIASTAAYTVIDKNGATIGIRAVLAATTVVAYIVYATHARIAEDAIFTMNARVFILETIASEIVRPIANAILIVCVFACFHWSYLSLLVGLVSRSAKWLRNKKCTEVTDSF
ncbi:MAG: hypothetical protein U0930_09140 [Pirellulales bacterium]